jgi:hypothetical protein
MADLCLFSTANIGNEMRGVQKVGQVLMSRNSVQKLVVKTMFRRERERERENKPPCGMLQACA